MLDSDPQDFASIDENNFESISNFNKDLRSQL
jgi:hypothetical protein